MNFCSRLLGLSLFLWWKDRPRTGYSQKFHDTQCLSSKILHKHCFHFPLGITMVSSENKSNTYANLKDKQYYGIFESDLNTSVIESLFIRLDQLNTSMHSGCFAFLWPLLNSSHRLTFLIAVSWTLDPPSFFTKTRQIWKDDLLVELLCAVASKKWHLRLARCLLI